MKTEKMKAKKMKMKIKPTWGYDRMNELVNDVLGDDAWPVRMRIAFVRYIEAHEKPPVDPDEALANRVYEEWAKGRTGVNKAVATDLALRAIKAAREQS